MKNLSTYILVSTFILASCGGGGGGGGGGSTPMPPSTSAPTINFSSSSANGYQYENTTISWTTTNATSCTASNAWTDTIGTSGSLNYTFNTEGTFTFDISCTGSGGTTTDSLTIQAFIYEKVNNTVTDYTWDGFALGQIVDWYNPGSYNGVFSETWSRYYDDIGWSNATALDVQVVEPGESTLNLSYSGTSRYDKDIALSLNFNGFNTSEIPLYEYGKDDPSYAFILGSFSDLDVSVFAGYPSYMEGKGIEYLAAAQLIGETKDGLRNYIFPTFYGDYTETSDLPSGTSNLNFETLHYYHEQAVGSSASDTYNQNVAVAGNGTLNFDYDAGTVSGEFTLNNWMELDEFLVGNGPNAQITSIGNLTVSIINGQISGNRFYADISWVDDDSINTETINVEIETNSSGDGNVYVIDGVQRKSLTLSVGTTYTFNHSDSHPLRFSRTSDGTHGGGSEYTSGVTTSSGVTTIEVTSATPITLYYYCDVHSGMGADITAVLPSDYSEIVGYLDGALFGPQGKEVGVSMIYYSVYDSNKPRDIGFGAGLGFGEKE